MARKGSIKYLQKAKSEKNDEFYTTLSDIERELGHYKKHFKNKVVFCNCDDPEESNFWKYFSLNFKYLGLKKLIATHFQSKKPSYRLEKTNGDTKKTPLKQNGDFRSPECIELLKQADVVVTNPPFSLFREYVGQLIKYNKKFLIVGNWNVISYKEIFKLIKENKIWIGINNNRNFSGFIVPKHYSLHGTEARIDEDGNRIVSSNNTCWFTNLDVVKRHEELILYKTYKGHEDEYPKYDNYDAINVNVTKDIPCDYRGVMGVPITFIDKYNPNQFEIVGQMATTKVDEFNHGYPYVNGKKIYARILIKNKNNGKENFE